jgi:hypothetical protein
MTLQNFGQPLLLVAASACKCGGCMTLQKSAFRWPHEAANWQWPTGALTTSEREELTALKREVKTLRLERDILKKATADRRQLFLPVGDN